jgi:hypothetical protein
VSVELHPAQSLGSAWIPNVCLDSMIFKKSSKKLKNLKNHLNTFSTRMVAGELTTDSLRFRASISGGSSLGLLEADVATANAEAAILVLLLYSHLKIIKSIKIINPLIQINAFNFY